MGGLLEASWGVLEAYCAVWRPSCASWSDLGAIRGSFGPSQEPFGAILACEGPLRGRSPSRKPTRETPRAPGSARNTGGPALKKLETWLQQQQHSCEPWGTPLRARGTVADKGGGLLRRQGLLRSPRGLLKKRPLRSTRGLLRGPCLLRSPPPSPHPPLRAADERGNVGVILVSAHLGPRQTVDRPRETATTSRGP